MDNEEHRSHTTFVGPIGLLLGALVVSMALSGCCNLLNCCGEESECQDHADYLIDHYDGPNTGGHDMGKYDGPNTGGHDKGSDVYQCTVRNRQLIDGFNNCSTEYRDCLDTNSVQVCDTKYKECYDGVVAGANL